jgi:hypothetical protein
VTAEQYAVMVYRLEEIERTVRHDHEPRIRDLESTVTRVVAKVTVWAAAGSLVGGAVVTAIVNLLVK